MIKKSWWVDFHFGHRRYRKRSPEKSRAGALAYEATLRKKLANGGLIDEPQVAVEAQTLACFAEEWLSSYVVPNNKPGEQKNKRNALRKSIIPFFGRMLITEITTRRVEQYKAYLLRQGSSPKTVNNQLAILNTCLVTAYEWLCIPGTPPKVKRLKCPPPRMDYLSPEECDLLLNHATDTTRDLILVALRTGMRQGELKGLQWSSIDWQNQSIVVRHSWNDDTKELGSTKSNRERHIPMHADVYGALFYKKRATGHVFTKESGRPLDDDYLQRRLRALCKKVSLRKIGWHTLRHTFASHLAMCGVPLNTVQALLGHSTIQMTMRYAHLAPSTLRQAIDMLGARTMLGQDFGQPVGNPWIASLARQGAQTPVSQEIA